MSSQKYRPLLISRTPLFIHFETFHAISLKPYAWNVRSRLLSTGVLRFKRALNKTSPRRASSSRAYLHENGLDDKILILQNQAGSHFRASFHPLVPCQLCKLNSKEHKRKSDNKIVKSYRVDLNGSNLLPELLHSALILADVTQRFLQISHLFIAAPPKNHVPPLSARICTHMYFLFLSPSEWHAHILRFSLSGPW